MRRTIIGVIITIVTIIIETESRGKKWHCPPFTHLCECQSRHTILVTANCNNLNLTTVPTFVQKFQRLKFDGNILPHINDLTFTNIREWPISELFISRCRIKTITDNTFSDLNLDFIDFSENKKINITQLGNCFKKLKLKGLDLTGIPLASKIVSFFNTPASSNLTFLRIASCGLTYLNKTMFKSFTNLEDIDISHNKLRSIDISVLPPIMALTARQTGLSELPTFYKPTDVNLVHLDVGYNCITNVSQLFKYGHIFNKLRELNIDSNPLASLPLLTFSRLKSLHILSLCNITSFLTDFEGINSASLKTLNISYNSLNPEKASRFFKYSRNIKDLKMNGTSLKEWQDDDIFNLFTPLCHSLRKLVLVNSYFKKIPSRALRCFTNMKILDLSSNNISWNSDEENPFENVTIKTRFLFKDNLLTVINKTSFPYSFMCNSTPEPEFLNFHGNPFSCTCQAHWFRNWMKNNYYRLGGPFGNNLLCKSPKEYQDKLFTSYDPPYEDCVGMNNAVLAGIALCGASVLFVSIATYLNNKNKKNQHDQFGYKIIE